MTLQLACLVRRSLQQAVGRWMGFPPRTPRQPPRSPNRSAERDRPSFSVPRPTIIVTMPNALVNYLNCISVLLAVVVYLLLYIYKICKKARAPEKPSASRRSRKR